MLALGHGPLHVSDDCEFLLNSWQNEVASVEWATAFFKPFYLGTDCVPHTVHIRINRLHTVFGHCVASNDVRLTSSLALNLCEYTKATERNVIYGGDDDTYGLPLFHYFSTSHHLLVCISQRKTLLATGVYHVVVIISFCDDSG
jgi:hypothetical protein